MSAIEIVTTLLSRDTGVKTLVANRIYPIEALQAPGGDYIVVNTVSSKSNDLIDVPGRYYRDRVTIECIATSALTALNIDEAAKVCLEGVTKQTVKNFIDVDIRFADVSFTDPNDARTAFRCTKQYFVWWKAQ